MKEEFNFKDQKAIAIYAPNGSMKTSLAKTFSDFSNDIPPKDRFFPNRTSVRRITDESGSEIDKSIIFAVEPYNESFSSSEKTSTLLVNSKLRKEYEQLNKEIDADKSTFLKSLKELSGSKKDLEKEISSSFTPKDNEFYDALSRIKGEMLKEKDSPLSGITYDIIFDDKILAFIETKDVKTAILEYIEKYTELLNASTYFEKGIFNYFNAATIAKNLADNGFFDAKHSVILNADKQKTINSKADLEEVIEEEKNAILTNKELRTRFDKFDKLIQKNTNLRDFHNYLLDNEFILPYFENIAAFKEAVWKSYFKIKIDLYNSLIEKYQKVEARRAEIEEEAKRESTQWHKVIDIFNSRFHVPFKINPENQIAVILGQESSLNLTFTFHDETDSVIVGKNELIRGLSTGEKKALYILNIIFEIETRKKSKKDTVFVIDDLADSFDYKNKYAIIEYLKENLEVPHFHQIILTHNFDFFRTIESRYVKYSQCFMAEKTSSGISLKRAEGIKNIFVNDWKPNFHADLKKRIASIPFIRNIIEYTKGDQDPGYRTLTSLLHWKSDSEGITDSHLAQIYNGIFGGDQMPTDKEVKVVDLINSEAEKCLDANDGFNLENKIIFSIAIRIKAEQFMIKKIDDPEILSSITSKQTSQLSSIFKSRFPDAQSAIEIIDRVMLMTPENIHLNSFMYEPILDMSDEHLKKLYRDILRISSD